MKVTIKDIAELAEVSIATVSRVLNNKDHVSEGTRKKVMKIAKNLNYKADFNARSLITKKTNTIGLIVPDLTNPFYASTSTVIENVLHEHGFSTIICNTNNKDNLQHEYINILQQRQVDGIILGSVRTQEKDLEQLDFEYLPYITYHRRLKNNNSNFVICNDKKGIWIAVEYLVNLGHSSIGFLSGPREFSTSIERLREFLEARSYFNLNSDPRLIKDGGYEEEKAWKQTEKLLKMPSCPSAILAANDIMAIAALDCCLKKGVSVPEDISIMGFDDITLASHARIRLTTISVKPEIMARKTADVFINKILTKKEDIKPVHVQLDPELKIRETTTNK